MPSMLVLSFSMLAIIFKAITIQRKPTLTDKNGDGAGLRVGGAENKQLGHYFFHCRHQHHCCHHRCRHHHHHCRHHHVIPTCKCSCHCPTSGSSRSPVDCSSSWYFHLFSTIWFFLGNLLGLTKIKRDSGPLCVVVDDLVVVEPINILRRLQSLWSVKIICW